MQKKENICGANDIKFHHYLTASSRLLKFLLYKDKNTYNGIVLEYVQLFCSLTCESTQKQNQTCDLKIGLKMRFHFMAQCSNIFVAQLGVRRSKTSKAQSGTHHVCEILHEQTHQNYMRLACSRQKMALEKERKKEINFTGHMCT